MVVAVVVDNPKIKIMIKDYSMVHRYVIAKTVALESLLEMLVSCILNLHVMESL